MAARSNSHRSVCGSRAIRTVTSLAVAVTTLLMPAILFSQATSTATKEARAIADSALARVIANASEMNRLPPDLIAYKANVQTELALVQRLSSGTERPLLAEQLASSLRWTRAGTYTQNVVGYRTQEIGLSYALLFLQTPWLNPVLYGNRLRSLAQFVADSYNPDSDRRRPATRPPRVLSHDDSLRLKRVLPPAGADSAQRQRPRPPRADDTIAIIHPLALDRNRYYQYSRGDTLVTLHSGDRSIPIVRVHVEPRADVKDSVALFVGDMDLDVSRGALVRMRGYFARAEVVRRRGILLSLIDAIAFIEFENAEHEGKYWLPAVQRVELQIMSPLTGDARGVLRIVSRFPSIAVNDTTLDSATMARADSLRLTARRRLVFASSDSLAQYSDWQYSMGSITAGLHADDFNDVGPDRYRPTGAPRLDVSVDRFADLVHFNRVEGLYTGLGARLALRDLLPGVVVKANAGWAWSEQTARGRISISRRSGPWDVGIRAGRSLDITNDFRPVTDSGSSLSALGTSDPYDYVDRKSAALSVSRSFANRQFQTRAEFGVADDRYAATTLKHGLWGKGEFLPNRGIDEGSYRKTAVSLEWHPSIDAAIYRSSLTSRLLYERGDGTLTYQRAEFRTVLVQLFGPFTFATRGDAGEVFGKSIPPQQLFELGRGQNLPGYAEKQFAGSRAAALRSVLLYRSPFLNQRIHITRNYWIPGITPGASVGIQSGWTDAPSDAARASILRLGYLPDSLGVLQPVSRVTDRVRSTVSVGLRFFNGNVFVGYARAIDHKAPWGLRIGGGF